MVSTKSNRSDFGPWMEPHRLHLINWQCPYQTGQAVTVTVPAVPSGGASKIAIAAVAQDPATKLDYYALAAIGYPTSTTTSSTTSSATILTGVTSSSSQAVPTAVPAGSGGAGASGGSNPALDLTVGGAGLLLIGAGGVVLARRRAAAQH